MKRRRVLVVLGTRPEAIKLAPVIQALKSDRAFESKVCATAQHRAILDQMLRVFRIKPDFDLNLMKRHQTPEEVLSRVVSAMRPLLSRQKPDLVVVQGDTTTALGAAISAFYQRIPVAHVEAGLRSYNPKDPFPEELNRVLIDHLSALHFAPTWIAKKNLEREALSGAGTFVTGNTVVDALRSASKAPGAQSKQRIVLVTLHRRESFGAPLRRIFGALLEIAERYADTRLIYPVHPNPEVHELAYRMLQHPRIRLSRPLPYLDFLNLMRSAYFLITDSGGLQEEAISLHKPVLVAREATERPELLRAGGGLLVGHDPRRIIREASRLLLDEKLHARMSRCRNPYGDGRAADRIVAAIRYWFKLGRRPVDWRP